MDTVTFPMPFRDLPLFRDLVRSLCMNSEDEHTTSVELDRELEDLRKFSLTLLMGFLTVHEISASHVLGATTLALLVYTINLHIAVNARFLRNSSALSKLFHAVPLVGIFCMAIFKFMIIVRSPRVAVAVLLACALPPLLAVIHPLRLYVTMMLARNMAPVIPVPVDTP